MRSRPSGSSVTAPIKVGTPTRAMTSRTATHRLRDRSWPPGSSAPSPHTARSGGSLASRRVLAMFELGHPDVLVRRVHGARPPHVHLERGHVERPPIRAARTGSPTERGPRGPRCRRRSAAPPRPSALDDREDQAVHEHDDEGDAPDARDGREPHRRVVVHLADAERPPGEAPERPQPAEPFEDGPQGRPAHRVQDGPARPADHGRREPEQPRPTAPSPG